MVTDTNGGAGTQVEDPPCPDPQKRFGQLQGWTAQDAVIAARRTAALTAMTARVDATNGLQRAYEDALTEKAPALQELLDGLKDLMANVECSIKDEARRKKILDCFCAQIPVDPVEPPEPTITEDPCPKAEQAAAKDLDDLLRQQKQITDEIDRHNADLDQLIGLPATLKTTIDDLLAKVKALTKGACEKSIDAERAFVMQLQYRHEYTQLQRKLTSAPTFICAVFQLVDELFVLFEWDVCVAGAIARAEKEKELEDAGTKDGDALIDEVLRCAKPEEPTTPPGGPGGDEDLDPCSCVDAPPTEPDPTEPYPAEPPPTEPYPAEPPPTQHPPEQNPPSSYRQPPADEPSTQR